MKYLKFYILYSCFLSCSFLYAQEYQYLFQDPNIAIEQRAENLISLLTTEEKVKQLMLDAPAVDRLGIDAYNWQPNYSLGDTQNKDVTVFPKAIGLAATFDSKLIERIASAISDEVRAQFNEQQKNERGHSYQGLSYYLPSLSLLGDPRWRSSEETFGEDPFLTAKLGFAFAKGLEGEHPSYLKVARVARDFILYAPSEVNAEIRRIDLWNSYLSASKVLLSNAKIEGIENRPIQVNVNPIGDHFSIIEKVLREEWQYSGCFITDYQHLTNFRDGLMINDSLEILVAKSLKNACIPNYENNFPVILESVKKGLVEEIDIDDRLRELFSIRFRLGLFDPESTVPYQNLTSEVVRSKAHLELAKEAAIKSMVLVKNENHLLPLKRELQSIFITGPTAETAPLVKLNWPGIKRLTLDFKEGRKDDVIIVSMGGSELERKNKCTVGLPETQIDYLRSLRRKIGKGKLIVLLSGNTALSNPEVYQLADALIYTWEPGDGKTDALNAILLGKANPSGRFPLTVVEKEEDLPSADNFSMKGRTYRFLEKDQLYPFGFGLSYTTFEYNNINISERRYKDKSVRLSVEVSNTGAYAGEEVVQLYVQFFDQRSRGPEFELKDFQRVWLEIGETKIVEFDITDTTLEQYDLYGYKFIPYGNFKVMVGGASPCERSKVLGLNSWQEVIIRHDWK